MIISTIFAFVILSSSVACVGYYLVFGKELGKLGVLVSVYLFIDILIITVQQSLRGLGNNLLFSISIKELLKYSWPMVPNNLSNWVLRLSDRLVITAALGIEANAVYAVANKMPTIFSSFQNTFTQAWQENASIAAQDNDKNEYYSQMCNWFFRLMIGIMAGLIMATPTIWRILVNGDYDEAYYQLPILYLGILFSCMSSTIGGIYIAHMKTKSVGLTTMGAAIVNLIIDLMLVNCIGIWAGSISTMISYLFLLIYRVRDVQKFQKINFNVSIAVSGTLFLVVMGYLSFRKNIVCDLINVFVCIAVLFIYDKDIITMIIKKIIKKFKR